MDKELQNKLFEKHPKIFVEKDLPMSQTCMCWGMECGNGWYWLIDNLCQCIQDYIDANHKEQVVALQVKEKFGSLSFYTNGCDDTVHGMIWFASYLSREICEDCGSTENVERTKGYWISHLCNKCIKDDDESKVKSRKE